MKMFVMKHLKSSLKCSLINKESDLGIRMHKA